MPTVGGLLAFAAVAAVLIAVPGPSVLFVIGRSIALGRRGGLISVLGNSLGAALLVAVVAVGLGSLIATSEVVFTALKLIGAAYLVLLGVQTIRHRGRGGAAVTGGPTRRTRLLMQGIVVGATNPKTAVFFAAVLPQFADWRAGALPAQLAVLGGLFVAMAFVSDGLWAIAAGTARQWFARSPRRIARLEALGGGLMIGLGGVLALARRAT